MIRDYEISVSAEDRARWTPPLLEYYINNKNKGEDEALDIIDSVFDQCSKGWNRAPKDLDTRIKMKTGFQWASHENLNPMKSKTSQQSSTKLSKPKISGTDYIYEHLDAKEKRWWDKRMEEYQTDFEFNQSADKPLLNQLVFEELLQRRLAIKQVQDEDNDFSKQMTEGLKRVTELQVKLGITREQRSGSLDNIDGNIAELALSLDKKLQDMPTNLKVEYEEELRYEALKRQRPPINVLPPKETMKAIINKEAKTNEGQINTRSAAEISDMAANIAKDKEAKQNDLPAGEIL